MPRELGHSAELRQHLTDHYFDQVASIFTIFDGPSNPFGDEIRQDIGHQGSLLDAVISVAAVHLADSNDDDKMLGFAFGVRAQAISKICEDLSKGFWKKNTFIASILLCMTEVNFTDVAFYCPKDIY
jgi:Fungal specific transcription factor domain